MDVPHIIAGRFRIECEIGRGGMGTVYRAKHLGLERPVAVKIIKPEFASDPDVNDRFMREARTMARLRHPHAAMIFDAGNLPDGRYFIVMEYVEGATLSEVLMREGTFAAQRAVMIAADICDVLGEAHRLGIIHRDLKPSNIILNERGVCVLDFGVAKVLATSADSTSTHATTGSGVIIGTPRYMSPEQCLGHPVGARSDLYSLGVLMYEMLGGRPPFSDPLPSAVLVKQATAPPPPLWELRRDVPRALTQAVHQLLSKLPEDRPANAAAARALLEKSLKKPAPETAGGPQPFSGTVAAMDSGRRIAVTTLMPAMALAAIALVIFVWGRSAFSQLEKAVPTNSPVAAAATSARASRDSSLAAAERPAETLAPLPSADEARRLAVSVSGHDAIGNVSVLRTERDASIIAVHDERDEGTSHLLVMERNGKGYHVTGRPALDVKGFRGASWTTESVDADGDGFADLLCTGTGARDDRAGCRLALYVPRTRQTYSVLLAGQTTRGGRPPKTLRRAIWSANTMKPEAAAYRAFLKQRADAFSNSAPANQSRQRETKPSTRGAR